MNISEPDLFTQAAEGQRRKTEGMARAAAANPSRLELARSIAVELAQRTGPITMDNVMHVLRNQHDITSLGNAAGSVFRGSEWEHTGEWRPSDRPSNHGRAQRVWRYVG